MRHIHQITLRGLDPELSSKIRELSEREGISLNKAALRLMGKGAGQTGEEEGLIGDSLDHLFGTWSKEEADEFLGNISSLGKIDQELWD
jgi:hypothetical protein